MRASEYQRIRLSIIGGIIPIEVCKCHACNFELDDIDKWHLISGTKYQLITKFSTKAKYKVKITFAERNVADLNFCYHPILDRSKVIGIEDLIELLPIDIQKNILFNLNEFR